MRFIAAGSMAGQMRGAAIAEALGVPCSSAFRDCGRDEWVVVVKYIAHCEQAKKAGARVIFDPVDVYAYEERGLVGSPYVDVVIAYSQPAASIYASMFPHARVKLIPHNWDHRIGGECRHTAFRPAYIGLAKNLHERLNVPSVGELQNMIGALTSYNCHVAEHHDYRSMTFKPATKVASAAAVGANIVTHRAAAAVELLGDDYPFYADGGLAYGIEKARAAFGGPEWERGLEIMRRVKERTSLAAVAALYREFME